MFCNKSGGKLDPICNVLFIREKTCHLAYIDEDSHFTCDVLLHYFVKAEVPKTLVI